MGETYVLAAVIFEIWAFLPTCLSPCPVFITITGACILLEVEPAGSGRSQDSYGRRWLPRWLDFKRLSKIARLNTTTPKFRRLALLRHCELFEIFAAVVNPRKFVPSLSLARLPARLWARKAASFEPGMTFLTSCSPSFSSSLASHTSARWASISNFEQKLVRINCLDMYNWSDAWNVGLQHALPSSLQALPDPLPPHTSSSRSTKIH